MPVWSRWVVSFVVAVAIIAVPSVYFRMRYDTEKRFRVVSPGQFYRCGQMSADAFRSNLKQHGIKMVVNLQDENPDPLLANGYFDRPSVLESEVCRENGAKFVFLSFKDDRGLISRKEASETNRPKVINDFLALCDDPSNRPMLIHCMAGLHRTGCLSAIWRMEYDHWSREDALRELRANGFGDRKATIANDYVLEYIHLYKPRWMDK